MNQKLKKLRIEIQESYFVISRKHKLKNSRENL